jgi:hypothetical protein
MSFEGIRRVIHAFQASDRRGWAFEFARAPVFH